MSRIKLIKEFMGSKMNKIDKSQEGFEEFQKLTSQLTDLIMETIFKFVRKEHEENVNEKTLALIISPALISSIASWITHYAELKEPESTILFDQLSFEILKIIKKYF